MCVLRVFVFGCKIKGDKLEVKDLGRRSTCIKRMNKERG